MPLPKNLFRGYLSGPKGLSPRFQKSLFALRGEIPQLRRTLLPILRDRASVQSSALAPKISDLPALRTYLQIVADIEGLPTPKSGFFDGIVVKEEDYSQQASHRLLTDSGVKELSLEEVIDYMLKSTPKLNTGSNNTLDDAISNAKEFKSTFGMEKLVQEYLAMDPSWWPSPGASIVELVAKNILTEAAVLPIQAIVNEAAQENSGLEIALDYSHSYAQLPRAMALSQFDPREIIETRSVFIAPLGRPEAMVALAITKNYFMGRVSIIRPAFDSLEEVCTGCAELFLDSIIYDYLPTDVRLPLSSHGLSDIAKVLKKEIDSKGVSLSEFVDDNYTKRPGEVHYFRDSSGELERTITPRSGEDFSNKAWRKPFDKLMETKKGYLSDLLKGQVEEVENLVKITGPTPELEEMATSIKKMNASLENTTGPDLYDTVSEVETNLQSISENIQTIIEGAKSSMSTEQQETIDAITKANENYKEQLEETSEKIDDLNNGKYEPEELEA